MSAQPDLPLMIPHDLHASGRELWISFTAEHRDLSWPLLRELERACAQYDRADAALARLVEGLAMQSNSFRAAGATEHGRVRPPDLPRRTNHA